MISRLFLRNLIMLLGMENNKKKTYRIQINLSSFIVLFTVLFVGLKLGNVNAWSWWWVFSPLWLPFASLAFSCFVIWLFGWLLFRNSRKNYKFDW